MFNQKNKQHTFLSKTDLSSSKKLVVKIIQVINLFKSNDLNKFNNLAIQVINLGEKFINKICKNFINKCTENASDEPIDEQLIKLFKIIFEENNYQINFSFLYNLWIKGVKNISFLKKSKQNLNGRFKRNAGKSENIFNRNGGNEENEGNEERRGNEEEEDEVQRRVNYNQWAIDNNFLNLLAFIILLVAILVRFFESFFY
ncbi:hypothetical protein ACQ4LE_005808 [Meloidogyne hapla]